MTTLERKAVLDQMSAEFYDPATNRDRRVVIAMQVRDWAEEEMPESRCLHCHRGGIYLPWDEALIEGHCYSEDGMTDYTRITKICEFCFDRLFGEEEKENS